MLLNKNHAVLFTTTFIMFVIECQLGKHIDNIYEKDNISDNFWINYYWLSNDILYHYKDHIEYKKILMYLSIQNTNIMLIYINVFYVYIGILYNIIADIDIIVDFHIRYILIVLSLKYEYIPTEYISGKTLVGICGCLYIRIKLYKLYKYIKNY